MARSFVSEARRRGLGTRKQRIGPIIERLAEAHSDAEIALHFGSDVELLISVMLSAQTTDVNVNRVTEKLFVKYRTPEDYLAVPVEELEQDIFQTGFYRQKTRSIRGAMRMLIEEFDGQVPRTIPELLRLPGVARKTANVVAAELGDAQGIVVDTHVRRLSQRLALTREEDPVKIERDLVKIVPRADWHRFPHLLIWHGRRVCDARKPRCEVLRDRGSVPVEPGRRTAGVGERLQSLQGFRRTLARMVVCSHCGQESPRARRDSAPRVARRSHLPSAARSARSSRSSSPTSSARRRRPSRATRRTCGLFWRRITHASGPSWSDSAARSRSSSATRSWRCSVRPSCTRTIRSGPFRAALAVRESRARRMLSCASRSIRARRSSRWTRTRSRGRGWLRETWSTPQPRIQSAAPVNGVLVGETTYRATAHLIEYREASVDRREGQGGARGRLGGSRAAVAFRQRCRAGAARGPRRPRAGGRCAARRPRSCAGGA